MSSEKSGLQYEEMDHTVAWSTKMKICGDNMEANR